MTTDILYDFREKIIEASLNPSKYRKCGIFKRKPTFTYDYSPINNLATEIVKPHGEEFLNEQLNDALEAVKEVAGEEAYNELTFAIRTGCITYET